MFSNCKHVNLHTRSKFYNHRSSILLLLEDKFFIHTSHNAQHITACDSERQHVRLQMSGWRLQNHWSVFSCYQCAKGRQRDDHTRRRGDGQKKAHSGSSTMMGSVFRQSGTAGGSFSRRVTYSVLYVLYVCMLWACMYCVLFCVVVLSPPPPPPVVILPLHRSPHLVPVIKSPHLVPVIKSPHLFQIYNQPFPFKESFVC